MSKFLRRGAMPRSFRKREIRTGHPTRAQKVESATDYLKSGPNQASLATGSSVRTQPAEFGTHPGDNLPWATTVGWGGCMRYGNIASSGQMPFSDDAVLDITLRLARLLERAPARPSSMR